MKKIIYITLLLLPTFCFAQLKLNENQTDVVFDSVYQVEKTKKEIHQLAQEWIAINFKDANEVIKLNTEDKIISKGNFQITVNSSGYNISYPIKFIMDISIKESRYKLNFNSFNILAEGNEIPLAPHFTNTTIENYTKKLQDNELAATTKYSKKYYSKLLNNPEKLQKAFEKQKILSSQFINLPSSKVESMAKDLHDYISKETTKSSDW